MISGSVNTVTTRVKVKEYDWNTGTDLGFLPVHQIGSFSGGKILLYVYGISDPEAVGTVNDLGKEFEVEIARLTWARLDIYLDDELQTTFPRIMGPSPLVATGYWAREHIAT